MKLYQTPADLDRARVHWANLLPASRMEVATKLMAESYALRRELNTAELDRARLRHQDARAAGRINLRNKLIDQLRKRLAKYGPVGGDLERSA